MPLLFIHSLVALDLSYLMMWDVLGVSPGWLTALMVALECTTVSILKMLEYAVGD